MHKTVSDYLNRACERIPEKRQQSVRAELSGHFAEAIDALVKSGMSEDEAALTVCEHMGNVEEVSLKLAAANRTSSIAVPIVGFILVAVTMLLSILATTDSIRWFIDPMSLISVTGIALGLALLGGASGMTLETLLSRLTKTTLYGGGISFFIGMIVLLVTLSDLPLLCGQMAVALLSALYGVLLSGLCLAASWLVRTIKPKDARDILEIRSTVLRS